MNSLKSKIRIATEQYCYIEFDFEGSVEDTIAEYHRIMSIYKGGTGLSDKDYNMAFDKYLTDGTMASEVYEAMNTEQQMIVQCLKRAFKRIKSKIT